MTTPTLDLSGLDAESTAADLYAELLSAGAEAAEYSALYASLTVKYGRLAHAANQVLRGELSLDGLAAVLQGLGK